MGHKQPINTTNKSEPSKSHLIKLLLETVMISFT